MFLNLAKFEINRSGKQAVGFYIAYLFLGMLLGAVVGTIAGSLTSGDPFQAGFIAGNIFAVIMCGFLATIVSLKKSLLSSFKTFFLIAITVLLSIFIGAPGGLIPVAYLTTMQNNNA